MVMNYKKKLIIIMALLLIVSLPMNIGAQTQFLICPIFCVNVTTCVTTDCEVVLRQMTSAFFEPYWGMSVRCMGTAGWGQWHVWEGRGVYSGTVCFLNTENQL